MRIGHIILEGHEIREFLTDLRKYGKVSGVGYDLSVGSIKKVISGFSKILIEKTYIDPDTYIPIEVQIIDDREMFVLFPGVYSITFDQGCKIPLDVVGFIEQRSSLIRMGAQIPHSPYERGYEVDQMGAIMIVHNFIQIERHSRVAQMMMYRVPKAEKGYDGQWQKERDVK